MEILCKRKRKLSLNMIKPLELTTNLIRNKEREVSQRSKVTTTTGTQLAKSPTGGPDLVNEQV